MKTTTQKYFSNTNYYYYYHYHKIYIYVQITSQILLVKASMFHVAVTPQNKVPAHTLQ